jgi:quercetin dioxygenase-like cupin family protein
MTLQIRRVVTGHDRNGKAVVKMDGLPESIGPMRPGVDSCVVWTSDATPVDLEAEEKGGELQDQGMRKVGTAHKGGTVFRIVEYQPGCTPRNHRTESIDYAVCMAGEIDMELDDGVTVTLRQGDVLVQRGTIHNWINRGKTPCRMAFVLIDAKLPTVKGKRLEHTG